jgi:hypothetical protein
MRGENNMGCDIHAFAERKNSENKWVLVMGGVFSNRNYGVFGFLANTRNYSVVTPISLPKGLPDDISNPVQAVRNIWAGDGHSDSWLSIEELISFDYDQEFEDRRVTKQIAPNYRDGGYTCEEETGIKTTFRNFLGSDFFQELDSLKECGAQRIIFWFDN